MVIGIPTFYFRQYCRLFVPQKLVVWATSFRLGHSPVWAMHCMRCTAWTGEWPNPHSTMPCSSCMTITKKTKVRALLRKTKK